jgi:hypothetical protein
LREPGGLHDLGADGAATWDQRIRLALSEIVETQGESDFVLPTLDTGISAVTLSDWTGFPVRVASCLTRERALRLLDVRADSIGSCGRVLQEEYLEWRVVTLQDGRIQRVELTTELPDYWCVLAAHEPKLLLAIVSEFAREPADPQEIFGGRNPYGAKITPEEREEAFAATMLGPAGTSRYNNGYSAICCMVQPSNVLRGLLRLAVASAKCCVVRDAVGRKQRCLTCAEATPLLGEAAQLGRGSDPVLVERLGRIAFEGRQLAFDDPIGIYIHGAEHTRLRTPCGDIVPREWFTLGRGTGQAESHDGRARYQRMTFEVPQEEQFAVGDLVDVATEQPIRYGGQIAELVILVVLLRVTEPDMIDVDRDSPIELQPSAADTIGCAQIRETERRLLALAVE